MTSNVLKILVDSRLDDALMNAASGRPLVVRARRAETPERLIERAVSGPAMLNTLPVDVSPNRTPQQALIEAVADVAPRAASFSAVCASPQLNYKLLTIDLRGHDAAPWLMLAGIFASERGKAEEGPALVLITDHVEVPAGCDLLDDGRFVGPAEASIFVGERCPTPNLMAECANSAAIEVARGDLTQLRAMLDLNDRERFDPTAWVSAQAVSESTLVWRGKEAICSTWLAVNNIKELRHRIWRGQVSVLFPWLAEGLSDFLVKHSGKLPRNLVDPWTDAVIPPDEFEWSNILYVLNRYLAPQAHCAFRLRKLRNALAHQNPLSWSDANRAEADLAALMGWS